MNWEWILEARPMKNRLRDKELADLGTVYQSTKQSVKLMCSRHDKLEVLMLEMNDKYESLVATMAKMNGNNGKGIQIESHMTQFQLVVA